MPAPHLSGGRLVPERARFDALMATQRSIIAAGNNSDRIFDAVVSMGLGVIPEADGVIVEMRDDEKLVYRAASGPAGAWVGRTIAISDSFAGRSMLDQTPRICGDIETEAMFDVAPYRSVGMRALMAVPLIQQGLSIGALKFYAREPHAFATRDLTVAELIASQLISGLIAIAEGTAVRARQKNASRFETITETLPQMIWAMAPDGRPTYANRRLLDFLGVDRIEDFGGTMLSILHPDFHEAARAVWRNATETQTSIDLESMALEPSGKSLWTLIHLVPVPTTARENEALEWIGVATDINDHKIMEIALQEAVHGRDLLLFEVNHRVKNSLQIVTGLLALHADRIDDPEARARLLDARAQVATIAQIHQSIYQTSEHDKVEFVGFLRALAGSLIGKGRSRRADLVFSGPETLLLPIDRGVPVALVAGEIITNAVKHASGGEEARIEVSVGLTDGCCLLEIADNGPGFPAGFDPANSTGLGMEIIFGLAQQAGGRIEFDPSDVGVRFRLTLANL